MMEMMDETHHGIDRSTLTDEERDLYDASLVGAIDRLHREVEGLKQSIIDALPRWLREVMYGMYGR